MKNWIGKAAVVLAGILVFLGALFWEADRRLPEAEEVNQWVKKEDGDFYGITETDDILKLFTAGTDGSVKAYAEFPAEGRSFLRAAALPEPEKDEDSGKTEEPEKDGEEKPQGGILLLRQYEEDGKQYYCLEQYSEKLELQKSREELELNGKILGNLTVDTENVYMTVVSEERKQAVTYFLNLKEEDAKAQIKEERTAKDGSFFIRAEGNGESFYASYSDGTNWCIQNNEAAEIDTFPADLKTVPEEIAGTLAVFRNCSEKLVGPALLYLIFYAAAVFLLYAFFIERSYRLRRLAVHEALLTGLLAVFIWGPEVFTGAEQIKSREKFAELQMQDLKEQMAGVVNLENTGVLLPTEEAYQKLYEKYLETQKQKSLQETFQAVYLVEKQGKGAAVLLGNDTPWGTAVDDEPGEAAEALVQKSAKTNSEQSGVISRNGRSSEVMVYPAEDNIQQNYFWVGVLNAESSYFQTEDWKTKVLPAGIGIWAGAALLLVLLVVIESSSMRIISQEMYEISCGRKGKVHRNGRGNREAQQMWNALEDYARSKERLQYLQDGMLRASARFVPERLEAVLEREGVEKIHAGDLAMLDGALGCLQISLKEEDQRQRIQKCGSILEILELSQEEDGILLADSVSLDSMWAAYPEDPQGAVQFGIHVLQNLKNEPETREISPVLLLHYTRYFYGAAGTKARLYPYLFAGESRRLLEIAEKMRELQIGMIITEAVRERISETTALRCIGYVSLEERQNLYEVLDAYQLSKKQALQKGNAQFEEALELYYTSNFYFARNKFTEVLKNCPQDQVAKWYLFRCEKMLSSDRQQNFNYELFAEE